MRLTDAARREFVCFRRDGRLTERNRSQHGRGVVAVAVPLVDGGRDGGDLAREAATAVILVVFVADGADAPPPCPPT